MFCFGTDIADEVENFQQSTIQVHRQYHGCDLTDELGQSLCADLGSLSDHG